MSLTSSLNIGKVKDCNKDNYTSDFNSWIKHRSQVSVSFSAIQMDLIKSATKQAVLTMVDFVILLIFIS